VLEVVVDDAVDLREYEIVETGRWPRGTGELTSGWEQLLGDIPARRLNLTPDQRQGHSGRQVCRQECRRDAASKMLSS
jgi:hypothetical protein